MNKKQYEPLKSLDCFLCSLTVSLVYRIMERIGLECLAEDSPFFLEIMKYETTAYSKEQSEGRELPLIFLSVGISAKLFQDTLRFAKEAGSTFNGVLCVRAIWSEGVTPYVITGEEKDLEWLETNRQTEQ